MYSLKFTLPLKSYITSSTVTWHSEGCNVVSTHHDVTNVPEFLGSVIAWFTVIRSILYSCPKMNVPDFRRTFLRENCILERRKSNQKHLHPKWNGYGEELVKCDTLNCCQRQMAWLTCYQGNDTTHSLKISFVNWLLLFYVDVHGTTYENSVNYLYHPM
jgi:hypothetical protein